MKNIIFIPLLFVFILVFTSSCGEASVEDAPFGSFSAIDNEWTIHTKQSKELRFPATAEERFELSNYADTSWSIALETKNESVIGSIDKILIYEGVIYILDRRRAKQILAFDLQGKFLFKLEESNTEEAHFVQPFDFSIDQSEKRIIVYDDTRERLFYYDLNGIFLESKPSGFLLYGVAGLENGDCLLNSFGRPEPELEEQQYRLAAIDKNGKQINKGLPYPKEECEFDYITNKFELTHFGEEVLYSPDFLGKIYSITKEGISLKYKVDFGSRAIAADFYKMEPMDFIDLYLYEGNTEQVVFAGSVFETKDYLLFHVHIGVENHTAIYNKITGDFKYGILEDDLANSFGIPMINTVYDNHLVSNVDSYYIYEHAANFRKIKSSHAGKLLDGLLPTSNPVLTFYKLKEANRLVTNF